MAKKILKSSYIETPLGLMVAVSDEKSLYLLQFLDWYDLESETNKLQVVISDGKSAPISSIESELKDYFAGSLKEFKTPIHIFGTPFQKLVWSELMKVGYGKTISYLEQAVAVGKKTAYRAVANANAANRIAIVIPCHRIINSNGDLGGYAGGTNRKKWLIDHEKR
jgi:O-6-methylguanine DNA methyltransferase